MRKAIAMILSITAVLLLTLTMMALDSKVVSGNVMVDVDETEDASESLTEAAEVDVDTADDDIDSKNAGKSETKQAERDARATEKAESHAAKSEGKAQGKKTNYKGIIQSAGDGTMTVLLKDESTVVIAITADTRFQIPGDKDMGAEALLPGVGVAVQAACCTDDGLPTALKVHVIPGKPEKKHRVGTVVEYTPGVSITIEGQDGDQTMFLLSEDLKILPEDRIETLTTGAKVTIISSDNHSDQPEASGIVIHPPDSD